MQAVSRGGPGRFSMLMPCQSLTCPVPTIKTARRLFRGHGGAVDAGPDVSSRRYLDMEMTAGRGPNYGGTVGGRYF